MDRPPIDTGADGGILVLVADDSRTILAVARTVLETDGCRVDTFADGLSALDAALARSYDMVVLDLDMPGLGGLAVAEAIRSQEAATGRPRTRLVVMTADAQGDVPGRCDAIGVDRLIAKSRDSIRSLRAMAASRDERPSAAHGRDDVQDLLCLYVREARDRAARLAGLAESGLFDELGRIGHQFHGSGAIHGLAELSGLGRELEQAARRGDGALVRDICSRISALVAGLPST